MENPTKRYGHMLEKYREIDEDEILSNLTAEELQQLEGEIDREVLNKIPEPVPEEEAYDYSTTTDEYASTEEEEDDACVQDMKETQTSNFSPKRGKPTSRSTARRSSVDKEQRKRTSKSPHQFKIPPLRKAKSREGLRRQKSEEGGELKKELMQAVKRRSKRRTCRANSSSVGRRYSRKNSSQLFRRRNSKVAKENKKDATDVNTNFITQEMLSLRPKLKKVQTREPAKVNDMLHGVSLGHVTSGVKDKELNEDNKMGVNPEDEDAEEQQSEEETDDSDLPADDAVAKANDNVHRRLNARPIGSDSRSDDMTSSTTAGSTSAEMYDVVGELSINPNSVEATILRVWEDDEDLTEVNLNNIQNVDMEVFEELASAMECNTHVKHLRVANVGLTDRPAKALASMLKRNKTMETLNVESNFITGDAALRLVAALRRNATLTELRLDNQRHIFGAKVEHEFSKMLKDNKTLLRFGYQFANPGPRMAASNVLTRNMDDVRKKRVMEQRKRAQAGHANRPTLRRQTSSEWYRKDKANKLRQLKEQGLDLRGVAKDEDVQKVLNQMKPSEFAMLEQWFTSRLLGSPGNDIPNDMKKSPKKESIRKETTPQRVESPRDQLLNSIRKQPIPALKKTKDRFCDTPSTSSDVERNTPSINIHEADVARPLTPLPPINVEGDQSYIFNPSDASADAASSTNGSDDIIEWKDGDEYDSDEYEVVEIEVTESDDDSENKSYVGDDVIHANVREEEIPESIVSSELNTDVNMTSAESDDGCDEQCESSGDDSTASSCGSDENLSRSDKKAAAIKALERLEIFDKYENLIHPSLKKDDSPSPRRKKVLSSPVSSNSSGSSCSPSTPRPVREDDSWISGRPYYKLGAK